VSGRRTPPLISSPLQAELLPYQLPISNPSFSTPWIGMEPPRTLPRQPFARGLTVHTPDSVWHAPMILNTVPTLSGAYCVPSDLRLPSCLPPYIASRCHSFPLPKASHRLGTSVTRTPTGTGTAACLSSLWLGEAWITSRRCCTYMACSAIQSFSRVVEALCSLCTLAQPFARHPHPHRREAVL
jgi:hypothetical protein